MAIPKKGSRTIVVGGVEYRWYIRRKPTYVQAMAEWIGRCGGVRFAVECADSPGQVLVVELAQSHPGTYAETKVAVVPSQVADAITRALEQGWKPTEPGGPFRLKDEADATTSDDSPELT